MNIYLATVIPFITFFAFYIMFSVSGTEPLLAIVLSIVFAGIPIYFIGQHGLPEWKPEKEKTND